MKRFLLYIVLIGFFVGVTLAWWNGTRTFFDAGVFTASGWAGIARLTGIYAALLLPFQLIIIGRVKWVETVFGLDKLSRVHRVNGLIIFSLIVAHPVLMVLSYAHLNETGIIAQYFLFLQGGVGEIFEATIGVLILLGTIIWSLSIVRRKLKYEWWYYVHLFNYFGAALIFLHVKEMAGTSQYIAWPIFWIALYVLTALNVIWFRFLRPSLRFWQHQFTVSKVEDLGIATSIYISGRNLDKFKIDAGQFMIFRFLQVGFWTQAHPFSLSWAPPTPSTPGNHKELRITAKKLGDYTNELPKIKVGTQVLIDGPHGIFTEKVISKEKLLFIAGGIGITPIRSMLENLDGRHTDKVLLYSNKTASETVLASELGDLAKQYKFKIINIYADEKVAGAEQGRLDKDMLSRLVPDISDRDIFLCGPPPMMLALRAAMIELGVPKDQIHFERFAL